MVLLLQRTLRCGSSLTAVRDIPADCDADAEIVCNDEVPPPG
jgi:hypothetical protein